LWDTKQANAIEKGNIIHKILSFVTYAEDAETAAQKAIDQGIITSDNKQDIQQSLQEIINHPKLAGYFKTEYLIYNERDIINDNGLLLRPDRVCIDQNNNAIIIDWLYRYSKATYIY